MRYVFIIIVLILVRGTFVSHSFIPSESMEPTIMTGESVVVDRVAYDLRYPFQRKLIKEYGAIRRGDVITFQYPKNKIINLIKRVIAIPGDLLEFENGRPIVNGNKLKTSKPIKISDGVFEYQETNGITYTVRRDVTKAVLTNSNVVIPTGSYFVMGDNRENSLDSRSWGYVKKEDILGKAKYVLISTDLSRMFKNI